MDFDNKMILSFSSKSQNEAFARTTVAAFILQIDPTISEIADIKTAVSEAVTNAVIHGYENKEGVVYLSCGYRDREVHIEVWDEGVGIEDIGKAREPLFTSKPELERSGLGFTVMESFMDSIEIESSKGSGTKIKLIKTLASS